MLKQTAHKECNFQTFTTDASSSFPVVLYLKSSICPSFPFTPLECLLPRSLTSISWKTSRSFLYPHPLWLFCCVDHIFFDTLFSLGFCDMSSPDSQCTSYHPQYPFQQHLVFHPSFCLLRTSPSFSGSNFRTNRKVKLMITSVKKFSHDKQCKWLLGFKNKLGTFNSNKKEIFLYTMYKLTAKVVLQVCLMRIIEVKIQSKKHEISYLIKNDLTSMIQDQTNCSPVITIRVTKTLINQKKSIS